MFREEATSVVAGFHVGPLLLVKMKFGDLGCCRGRKTQRIWRKPLKHCKNQQPTQPTYGTGLELNHHTGGRQALSPMRNPCSPNRN